MQTDTAFLDAGCEAWTRSTIRTNLWRMKSRLEFDDLYSEAWLVFHKVSNRYTELAEKHLMAIYMRSFINRISDLAREHTRHADNLHHDSEEYDATVDSVQGTDFASDIARLYLGADEVTRAALDAALGETSEKPYKGCRNRLFDEICGLKRGTKSASRLKRYLRDD